MGRRRAPLAVTLWSASGVGQWTSLTHPARSKARMSRADESHWWPRSAVAGRAGKGVVAVVPRLAHADDREHGDVAAAVLGRERATPEHVTQRVDAPRDVVQQEHAHEPGPEQTR